jgi:hypothetical protein
MNADENPNEAEKPIPSDAESPNDQGWRQSPDSDEETDRRKEKWHSFETT